MNRRQLSLTSLLLLLAALPLWIAMIVLLPTYPGYGGSPSRFFIAPIVLGGMTCALHRLFRRLQDGWAIAALLSPTICFGTLLVVAWIASRL